MTPTNATPPGEVGGFSPARVNRLRAALQGHVRAGKIPGLVALVHHRGREHVEAVGNFSFDSDVPMRRDTIFRLASMTKPLTAVAAMILVEECRIRLDDAVDPWLPELADRRVLRDIAGSLDDTVPALRPITLRDLLTFRSGYGEVGFIAPMSPLQQAMMAAQLPLSTWPYLGSADELIRALSALPLACQPGERWLYHMSSEILGILIARVSGQTLGSFMRDRIFEPLGMKDTGFFVPAADLHRLPTCYGIDFATGNLVVLDKPEGGHASRQPAFESGGGGLVSTVDDLLTFGQMMLSNGVLGAERILSRPAIQLMTTDHITPEQKEASPFFENYWLYYGWGFGMGLVTRRGDLAGVPGRFGWDGAFGTSWWIDPREQLIGIFMSQRRPDALGLPTAILDFWTSAYQLIED